MSYISHCFDVFVTEQVQLHYAVDVVENSKEARLGIDERIFRN